MAAELAKGRNSMGIFQDLVEHHGYVGSYDAVKRFARQFVDREPKVFCRFEMPPGQEDTLSMEKVVFSRLSLPWWNVTRVTLLRSVTLMRAEMSR